MGQRRGRGETVGKSLVVWFPLKGVEEAGQAGLGLASLNGFRGLWGRGSVSGGLVLALE